MGFVGDVLKSVEGIQYLYIIGIFIFLGLFVVMIYRTMKIPGKDLLEFKSSILDNNTIEPNDIK
ncbi:MAG: hypothetical protein WCP85_08110 [Mariniphaga sp.]